MKNVLISIDLSDFPGKIIDLFHRISTYYESKYLCDLRSTPKACLYSSGRWISIFI